MLKKAISASQTSTTFRLIANNTCMHECVDLKDHANFLGHMTQSPLFPRAFIYDTYRINCGLQKIVYPTKFMSSEWIRPEDVHFYDEIGAGKIVLKLTERIFPTDWLTSVVAAYAAEKKEGNLVDILNFPGGKIPGQLHRSHIVKAIAKGNIKPKKFQTFVAASALLPVSIDNSQLDGFLEGMQKIDCSRTFCNDREWHGNGEGGDGCGYCYSFAKRAISMDEQARHEAISVTTQLLDDLYQGKF